MSTTGTIGSSWPGRVTQADRQNEPSCRPAAPDRSEMGALLARLHPPGLMMPATPRSRGGVRSCEALQHGAAGACRFVALNPVRVRSKLSSGEIRTWDDAGSSHAVAHRWLQRHACRRAARSEAGPGGVSPGAPAVPRRGCRCHAGRACRRCDDRLRRLGTARRLPAGVDATGAYGSSSRWATRMPTPASSTSSAMTPAPRR